MYKIVQEMDQIILYCPLKVIYMPLLNNKDLDHIITSLGVALLTLLIPLAVGSLLDVYQKRREKELDYTQLDLQVILNRVFKIKRLVCSVFLLFVPMLFWETTISLTFQFLELILASIGIFFTGKTIYEVVNWIKGSVFKYRLEYLKKLKPSEDMKISWISVWSANGNLLENIKPDFEFFNIFTKTLKSLMLNATKEKNSDILLKLISNFKYYIERRSLYFIVSSKEDFSNCFLADMMDINVKIYKLYEKITVVNETKKSIKIAINFIREILLYIEKKYIEASRLVWFSKCLNQHLAEIAKDDSLTLEQKKTYLYSLCNSIFKQLFSLTQGNISNTSKLKELPEDWKLTFDNLRNKDNIFSLLLIENFIDWVEQLVKNREEIVNLYESMQHLFPNYDIKLLIKAFKFAFVPKAENKGIIESIIEYEWNPLILEQEESIKVKNGRELATLQLLNLLGEKDNRLMRLIDEAFLKTCKEEIENIHYSNENIISELTYYSFLINKLLELKSKKVTKS